MNDDCDKVIEQLIRKDEWNAAIEAAANKVESAGNILLAYEIRKMKK